jgi:alpha-mannosidase
MTIQRENHDIAALHAKLRLIAPAVMIRREVLPLFLYAPLGSNDNSFEVAKRNALKSGVEIPYNTYWGEWQKHFIMRGSYQIPEDWDLNQATALYLPLGDASDHFNTHPEALVYIDDTPFTSVDVRHRLLMLPEQQRDYAAHTLWLHGWTGLGGSLWGDDRPRLYMQPCYVVQLDDLTQRFVTLAGTALETVETLHADDPIRANLLNALRAAFAVLDTRHPVPGERFYESVPGAYMALVDQISLAGDPLNVRVHAVGHAHIDIAWLWTTDIGGDKAVRSFYTALHLMEQYPEYVYAQSQPQLYEFVRQSDPALFERIKQRVAEKRWEPLGGMWVESDCNLPGAESLVRQFMLGRAYFREQFGAGADSPVLWLPDAFGFPHTLPQIAAEAGMRYFFTIKPRWSAVNQIPYDTFWWQGLDGTRLLAHFSTTPEPGRPTFPPTYNAEARAETVIGSWRNARQKARQRDILMSYGWGDGGGGPTSDMLEAIRVMRAFPGVPHVIPSRAVDFFEALESNNGESAPTWNDELYLETHQGTYTSQHVTKNRHRAVERYAHNMEFLAAMTHRLYPEDYAYPVEKFNEIWQRI